MHDAHREDLLAAAKVVVRGDSVEWDATRTALRVAFICDPVGDHWAETDGETLWLNVHKTFSTESLMLTMAHEELHGRLRRARTGFALAEETEHRVMARVDPNLV